MRVKFHGYNFGDRMLEGVFFQADIDNGVVSNVAIDPGSDGRYWEGLNHKKWLAEGKAFLERHLKSHGSLEAMIGDEIVEPVV